MAVSHMNDGIRPHAISLPISLDFILLYGSVRICFWNHPQKHKNPQKPDIRAPAGFSIFIFSSHHEHAIAKAIKSVSILYGMPVCRHGMLISGKSADQHDQRAFRQMKVGDQPVENLEPITGINENAGPSLSRLHPAVRQPDAFQCPAAGRSHRDNPSAPLPCPVEQIRRFL